MKQTIHKTTYMKNIVLFLLLVNCLTIKTFSQNSKQLLLSKIKNPQKTKVLDSTRQYYIKTRDTIFYTKISNNTDSSIFIPIKHTKYKDTLFAYTKIYGKSKGKIQYKNIKLPIYTYDTLNIKFVEILYIKKDLCKNDKWLEAPAWIGILAAGGLIIGLPIAIATNTVKDWVIFEGILTGLSAVPLFVGTRKIKYDLTNKWTLERQ